MKRTKNRIQHHLSPDAKGPVRIMVAHSVTEAYKYKLMLNRLGVPFNVRNEDLQSYVGYSAAGPIEFWVPAAVAEKAIEGLNASFEIDAEAIPETCPACSTPNPHKRYTCPDCGLSLV